MKVKFLAAKYTKPINLPEGLLKKLPEKVCLFTTVQFIDQLEKLFEQLEIAGKQVILSENTNYYYNRKKARKGQLLGCSLETVKDAQAFLYIGDGMFHPQILMVKNEQPVYAYNPLSNKWQKLDDKFKEKIRKKQKAAYSKFLMSKEVGVIVSTKPGQNLLERALKLKEEHPDKNFYIIAFNDIDFNALENFSFIECFVNTACYRISIDDSEKIRKPIINIDDLQTLAL